MQVLEGRVCLDVEGRERVLEPEDGEAVVDPWANHRFYPLPISDMKRDRDGGKVTTILLWGGETEEIFRVDGMFFQNWYGYLDEVIMGHAKMDLIQVLCVSGNPNSVS